MMLEESRIGDGVCLLEICVRDHRYGSYAYYLESVARRAFLIRYRPPFKSGWQKRAKSYRRAMELPKRWFVNLLLNPFI